MIYYFSVRINADARLLERECEPEEAELLAAKEHKQCACNQLAQAESCSVDTAIESLLVALAYCRSGTCAIRNISARKLW